MVYILIEDGEVVKASMTHDFSDDAESMLERNIDEELEDAGYDPDDVSYETRAEFAISAGYNGGFVYADCVDLDIDREYEDEKFETRKGDNLNYSSVIEALKDDPYDEDGELKEVYDDYDW